jgi:hypothetical protein
MVTRSRDSSMPRDVSRAPATAGRSSTPSPRRSTRPQTTPRSGATSTFHRASRSATLCRQRPHAAADPRRRLRSRAPRTRRRARVTPGVGAVGSSARSHSPLAAESMRSVATGFQCLRACAERLEAAIGRRQGRLERTFDDTTLQRARELEPPKTVDQVWGPRASSAKWPGTRLQPRRDGCASLVRPAHGCRRLQYGCHAVAAEMHR